MTKVEGPPRLPRRLLPELPLPRSLAAGNRQPARATSTSTANTTGLQRRPDHQLLQPVRVVPARSGRHRQQERAERADDRRASGSTRCTSATAGRRPPKLTLDLGLRWEFYPIMHRADGRGLDRLDLDQRSTCIVAGRGGNPQTNGMKPAWTTSRRASAASTASTTRRCSAPATASPTTRGRGRARCAATTTIR